MKTRVSIVICDRCSGTGKVDIGSHEFDWEKCPECDGLGRLKKIETYEKLVKTEVANG